MKIFQFEPDFQLISAFKVPNNVGLSICFFGDTYFFRIVWIFSKSWHAFVVYVYWIGDDFAFIADVLLRLRFTEQSEYRDSVNFASQLLFVL